MIDANGVTKCIAMLREEALHVYAETGLTPRKMMRQMNGMVDEIQKSLIEISRLRARLFSVQDASADDFEMVDINVSRISDIMIAHARQKAFREGMYRADEIWRNRKKDNTDWEVSRMVQLEASTSTEKNEPKP